MPLEDRLTNRVEQLIRKADAVLATEGSDAYIGDQVEYGIFVEWQTQALNFLTNLLGTGHVYVESFKKTVNESSPSQVEAGQGILRAVREDIQGGYLTDVRALVSAEVFTDFLEMAEHLHEGGYKDPAASLAGAVLEDGLRKIAATHGIKAKTKDDLGSLNQRIADGNVYSRLMQKKI
jgi:hypothetical protein